MTDVDMTLLQAADCIFMNSRKPETYQESLDYELESWSTMRCSIVLQLSVMCVVPTPLGVKPIKSRYVSKRKIRNTGQDWQRWSLVRCQV